LLKTRSLCLRCLCSALLLRTRPPGPAAPPARHTHASLARSRRAAKKAAAKATPKKAAAKKTPAKKTPKSAAKKATPKSAAKKK
jgi:hypothetical protein